MRTRKFKLIGADYCLQHHGIRKEDAELCDFSGDDSFSCCLTPLGYIKGEYSGPRGQQKRQKGH